MSTASFVGPKAECTRALAPTPRAGPAQDQSTSMWSVNRSWLARTSRTSYTAVRDWGTSTETVTGWGVMMYQTVHCPDAPWQPPRRAAAARERPHRPAWAQRPVAARAGGGDRDQPPHAHPPLRLQAGAVGGGHPGRR